MTLSPFEVERREFGRRLFGYRRTEVDKFLDEIRGTLVGLWQERTDLREQVERLSERVTRYSTVEDQLKNTLLLAQDSAERAQEQARRESELVLREAGQKAREVVHNAHDEKQRLEKTARILQSAEMEARARMRTLAEAVLSQLDDTEQASIESATRLRAIVTSVSTTPAAERTGQQPAARAAAAAEAAAESTAAQARAAAREERREATRRSSTTDTGRFTPQRRAATASAHEDAAAATTVLAPPPRTDGASADR